jgi:hypothetical protein
VTSTFATTTIESACITARVVTWGISVIEEPA